MKTNCTLIATIPSLSNMIKVSRVFAEPNVSELRFNTGSRSPFSPKETVIRLLRLAKQYGKNVWIDIKGRQPRINVWADPMFECIELNHSIKVDLPARVIFRSGYSSEISYYNENKIFLKEPPREALGKGQSINIIGENFSITDDYLTPLDKEYLQALKDLCIANKYTKSDYSAQDVHIMASFVESKEDLDTIRDFLGIKSIFDIDFCSKIESQKGLSFLRTGYLPTYSFIMAARDDLYIELGFDYLKMKDALKEIVYNYCSPIYASRIFSSLEKQEKVNLSDFEDLEMMYQMGYRFFMLSDGICNYAFDKAIKAWEVFKNA